MRGCGQSLAREGRAYRCPRLHSFDLARTGYLNLLQPQDRRSANPGDTRGAAEARRRLYDAGHGAPLIAELERQLAAFDPPPRPAVLDVGCGEGSPLAALAAALPFAAHGLDLSAPAIELAARRYGDLGNTSSGDATWVVANADRFVPYAADTFDVVLALSSRLDAGEAGRVLAPNGRLLVATPAADDLVELREALLGEGQHRDRMARTIAALAPAFVPEARATVRHVATLDGAGVRDALAATYRGGRRSQQARLATLGPMRVTMSHEVARFRRAR
ncbi:MAG TPA: methyltransferase domain-containing protein [Thermoanaerobaculia bacterium]|nr:methyltransferase domain-containing protein [Thermoanaerobaculia bacterium]